MGFHGVMGEDLSDAEAVAILIRRLRETVGLPPVKIKTRGFDGSAQLLRKGKAQLSGWEKAGCLRAVVCHDADRDPPAQRRARCERDVVRASRVAIPWCVVVPTQELEAWFLADVARLANVFDRCGRLTQHNNPESIADPKERLRELTPHPRTGHYRYHPPTHNPQMAERVDLAAVERRCPSFAVLADFVRSELPPAPVAPPLAGGQQAPPPAAPPEAGT